MTIRQSTSFLCSPFNSPLSLHQTETETDSTAAVHLPTLDMPFVQLMLTNHFTYTLQSRERSFVVQSSLFSGKSGARIIQEEMDGGEWEEGGLEVDYVSSHWW